MRANDGIGFDVAPGEICGLLGHNGSGKTTLLNQVIGLVRPTSGEVIVAGHDAVADPHTARRLCSYQPQTHNPIDGITPRQAVRLMARLRGATRREARDRTEELLTALDILPWADRQGSTLSGGVKRLTGFAMTAIRPGRLVMLDEPTNDVDPVRRTLLWQLIRDLADAGCAVLLVTHNVIEAERAVDRLLILDRGAVVAHGTPAQLRGDDADRVRLELLAVDQATAARLAADNGGTVTGRRVMSTVDVGEVSNLIAWAQRQRDRRLIEEFSVAPVSLEDVYVRILGSTGHRPGEPVDDGRRS